jgi:putative ABC transport system permease protein
MAWREVRASWVRLLFFFVCVALGVAAIVVLRSVIQNIRETLTSEARQIVGGDIVVQTGRPWQPEQLDLLAREFAQGGVTARSDAIETRTMAATGTRERGRVRLVELKGVTAGYPMYGGVTLEDGRALDPTLLSGFGIVVPREFTVEMGVAAGGTVRVGGRDFVIRGVAVEDRVQRGSGGFAFGPRLYIALDDLKALGLLGFGSSATYQSFLRVPEDRVDPLTRRLRTVFANQQVGVRSWRGFEDRLGQNLVTAENYLSLVGFAMVVLGGIGVWSVTRVIVQQKVRSVAILKCVGASGVQVLGAYLLQILWLAVSGSLLGIVLAAVSLLFVPASMLEPLGIERATVTWSAALQGLAVGLLVSLLFALVPLLEMRFVKPLLLLRADTAQSARRADWVSRFAGALTLAALVLVAVWQAGSLRAGLFVSGGLAVVWVVLYVASRWLVKLAARLSRARSFALRHAVISLARPGNQTRVILMAVGLGCFFVIAVRAMQHNLLAEFAAQLGESSPDLVLIDIQADQAEGLRALAAPYAIEPPRLMPLMRGRLTGLRGARVNRWSAEEIRQTNRLTREFGITYRDHLQPNEELLAGAFWSSPLADKPADVDTEVSISEEVEEQGGVGVGDLVRLDFAGQPVVARITSVRRVAWDETQNGGFFFVLRPSPIIATLPQSFVGFMRTGDAPEKSAAFQRQMVDAYPNVTAIDVRAVVASVRDVVDNITTGVTVVGIVTLFGGALILAGAVALTKFQRLYEAAIYRTLGASTRVIASMVAAEYGVLGLLAGILGAAGAFGLSWVLAEYLFEITWRPATGVIALGAALTAIFVCVVGLLASLDVLWRKPLASLKEQ